MQPRSARLNKNNRIQFVQVVMKDKFGHVQQPTMQAFIDRWTPKIYDLVYGPYLEALKLTPPWAVEETKTLYVMPPNKTINIEFKLSVKQVIFRTNKYPTWPEDHQIHQEYLQYCQNLDDYMTKTRAFERQIRQLVESCNTSAQLYATWPEALKYAACFPYVPKETRPEPTVTQVEIDLSLLMAQPTVILSSNN